VEDTLALKVCGRAITESEVSAILELVESCGGLSRNELAHTVCEHMAWETVSGRHKVAACMGLLERLEGEGRLRLPAKHKQGGRRRKEVLTLTERTREQATLDMSLDALGPVSLEVVRGREDNTLFNEYIARYHPLGYKRPFGCVLRYKIMSRYGQLGCILMSGPARALAIRDSYIGWSVALRRRNLPFVVNNSRYLLFTWVKVKHLASHVLGQLARRLRKDYAQEFGYEPMLMETFVDPREYEGTCYRAAGWQELGKTKGIGKRFTKGASGSEEKGGGVVAGKAET